MDKQLPPKPVTRQRVQMADIARLADASVSTVSRALSGSPLIPESTRQRIIEIAKACNYQINVSAANLRKRDAHTVIGVALLGDSLQAISDPFILHVLGSVADALDERGMDLLLTRLSPSKKERMQAMVNSGQVAGLIVIGQVNWHDYLNAIADEGVPLAVWGASLPDMRYSLVGGDNQTGGYMATRHLIGRGCRRIAFFGDTSHPEAQLRHKGYLQALEEAGLQVDPRLHQHFVFGDENIQVLIRDWLDQQPDFDGVFAAADMAALSIMGVLNERGIKVPGQIKVSGYDDIALAAHSLPALTTVQQNTRLAGQELVRLVFESIEGRPARRVLLPTHLIVRESTVAYTPKP